jgi:ribosomal protein S18 acetylase RimI-like enzyme
VGIVYAGKLGLSMRMGHGFLPRLRRATAMASVESLRNLWPTAGELLLMVKLLVTYLEMTRPPQGQALPSPVSDAKIEREHLSPSAYLSIWRSVGEPLQWDQRSRMPSDDLRRFLNNQSSHIHILRVAGQPVGLCEFEGVGQAEDELTNFGLIPEMQGRKLGPYLLDHAIRSVWGYPTKRLWLHTDTQDHPKAVRTYRRAGFSIYRSAVECFPD